jgi:creatinine amidohydrolase
MSGAAVPGVRLEDLSWDQAEPLLRRMPVALLPLGAFCKEHGLHLPLNTDARTAEHFARALARRLAVVVLPTLGYGYYPAFVEYPGSIHVRAAAFRDVLIDIAGSLARHGTRALYVINTGLSTRVPLAEARAALASESFRFEYTDWEKASEAVRAAVQTQAAGTHADELETSLLLHIAPEVVQLERALPDVHETRGPGGLTRDPQAKTGLFSPTGAYGDPTRATREKGRLLEQAILAHLTAEIEALQKSVSAP